MPKRLAVDIGGTFTDLVLEIDGKRLTMKVLTTPTAPERAVMDGTRELLADAKIAAKDIEVFIHGTTLATNAIIERKGARTALIATDGFRDTLDIAYESRYDQYDVFIDKPPSLVGRQLRFTVPERVDARGKVLKPLDEAAVHGVAEQLKTHDIQSVAVALMHSYVNPAHERRIGEILAAALPNVSITLSSDVCPEIREYERTSTTCANAYVQPLMAGYLARLNSQLSAAGFACPVYLMTSGGGITTIETAMRFPIRLVESGPAGGAILAAHVAAECREDRILSFDMGGTTAKVCLIHDTQPQTSRSFEVDRAARFLKGSGLPLRIPVIEMVEIGAGGGSIARIDAMRRITVGPDSSGAEPGPACYGRGGTNPTVTDSDVVLGKIDPTRFAAGKMALDTAAAEAALSRNIGQKLNLSAPLAAFGVMEMVDENMANAARVHSVERGSNVADHTLLAFGGAAPLHAARLAEKLGIKRILVPTNAGVGSAVGFLLAPIAYEVVRSRYMRLRDFAPAAANEIVAEMRGDAHAVVAPGAGGQTLVETRQAYMRYVGQGHEIVVSLPVRDMVAGDAKELATLFEDEYRKHYARTIPDADVEILSWTLSLSTPVQAPEPLAKINAASAAAPVGRRNVFDPANESFADVPIYLRGSLAPGAKVAGPAIIAEDETTTFVSANFDAMINAKGYILMEARA
jgi:N-methylhydantoinase A